MKKQIDVTHTHEGIGHKSAGQGEGRQREGTWRIDKTA
jgi:hypothetical protein